MIESDIRWVARLTPLTDSTVDVVLASGVGLDVWERQPDALLVVASKAQLSELERRGLAHVQWLSTQAEFTRRAERPSDRDEGGGSE
jgi:hypothetical protein